MRIPEYFDQTPTPRPTETGIEALARSARVVGAEREEQARRIGGAIGQVGEQLAGAADKYFGQQEVSAGAAHFMTDLMAPALQRYNEERVKADPNDLGFTDRFMQAFNEDPAVQNWTQQFHTTAGRAMATRQINDLRDHMFNKAHADQGVFAAQAFDQNLETQVNTATLAAAKDPSAVPMLLGQIKAWGQEYVGAHGALPAEAVAHINGTVMQKAGEEIVKAGARAAIWNTRQGDPEAALNKYMSHPEIAPYAKGGDFLTEAKQAASYAKSEARAAAAEARAARAEQRDTAMAGWWGMGVQKDATGHATGWNVTQEMRDAVPQMIQRGIIHAQDAGVMARLLETDARQRETGKEVVTDPAVRDDISKRVNVLPGQDGYITQQEFNQLQIDGKASPEFIAQARAWQEHSIRDPAWVEASSQFDKLMTQLKPMFTATNLLTGKQDPAGDQAFSDAYFHGKQALENAIRQNPNTPINSYFDRTNSNYIAQGLDIPTMKKAAKDYLARQHLTPAGTEDTSKGGVAPGPAPFRGMKPGEDPNDYLRKLKQGHE